MLFEISWAIRADVYLLKPFCTVPLLREKNCRNSIEFIFSQLCLNYWFVLHVNQHHHFKTRVWHILHPPSPPPHPFLLREGGLSFWPIFQKGGLDRISIFRGGLLGRRRTTLFRESCSFYIKNKLKSQIFNNKKSLSSKMFFSVTTKNLIEEILTKNLVTFKKWDEIKDEIF